LQEVFLRKNNWYLEVEEALELGVIDGIHGYTNPGDALLNEQQDDYCSQCITNGLNDSCEGCDMN